MPPYFFKVGNHMESNVAVTRKIKQLEVEGGTCPIAGYANECCAGQSAPSAPTPSLHHWIQLYIQFLPMAHSSTAALTVVSAQLDCHTERSEKSASIIIIIIIVFVSICLSLIVFI